MVWCRFNMQAKWLNILQRCSVIKVHNIDTGKNNSATVTLKKVVFQTGIVREWFLTSNQNVPMRGRPHCFTVDSPAPRKPHWSLHAVNQANWTHNACWSLYEKMWRTGVDILNENILSNLGALPILTLIKIVALESFSGIVNHTKLNERHLCAFCVHILTS